MVVAVVVVLGAGIGVAVAVGTNSDSGLPLGAPSSTTAGSPGAGTSSGSTKNGKGKKQGKKQGKKGKQGKNTVIRGTITAESGSTWTVKTLRGTTTKVTIGADTKFGTKQAPSKASDFPVGHTVAIAGMPASGGDGAFTARRVRTPAVKGQGKTGGSATPSPTPSPTPSSTPS